MTRTLPATGRVIAAEPAYTFGRLRQMRTSSGIAYGLPLKLDGKVVGEVENQGDGGGTWFRPHVAGAADEWAAFVVACREIDPERYGPNRAAAEERVADDLVDEADLYARLTRAAKSARVYRKTEGWGVENGPNDPYGYASLKNTDAATGPDAADFHAQLTARGYTHHWIGSEWTTIASPTTEEPAVTDTDTLTRDPANGIADAKAHALAKKAEAERARQERIKAAGRRLAALPKDAQTRVQGNAARAEKAGKEAGKRTASVVYLEDALAAEEKKQGGTVPEQRPPTPRERSKPKETPEQLAPEKKSALPGASKATAKRTKRPTSGPAAVKATVTVEVPATHKTCTRCHESKPVADFLNKNGTGRPRPTCRPCYNEAWREFDRARKAKAKADAEASA